MIVGVDADLAVVLPMLGDGIWEYLSPFLIYSIWTFKVAS